MAKFNFSTLPKKSLVTLGIYLGVLVVFILLTIVPARRESAALDDQIKKIRSRIEEQKILKPIYQNLLKKAQLEPPEGIGLVEKKKLKKGETETVGSRLSDMAVRSNLTLAQFLPKVETIISGTGLMMVDFTLKGEFINLHPFLIQLCQTPYLEQIEHIQIRAVRDTNEFQFRIWLAYE